MFQASININININALKGVGATAMTMLDHHTVLGVRKNSSRHEIKRAYRRLARRFHPDVCKDTDSERRFKQINRAYESMIKVDYGFQPECGFACSVEDLFNSDGHFAYDHEQAVPMDLFYDGQWFEGLDVASCTNADRQDVMVDDEAFITGFEPKKKSV
eukprot:Gb_13364 [translate_table: standard]